jgi:predicted dehydrogenase
MTKAPFRWAILGTGAVSRKFVLGLNALGGQAIAASVASRDPKNAAAFAASLGVSRAAESYDAAIAEDIDAVYIATPATHHEAHARLAFAKGKPALIEKPLADTVLAAERIVEAATDANVYATEALWTRFQPAIQKAKVCVETGKLGDLRGFHGTFLGANVADPKVSLFNPDQAGGALLHRGIYPISLARHFCGPIAHVQAAGRQGATGVDEDASVLLTHANGALSTIRASLSTADPNPAVLWGTKARLELAAPIWRPEGARLFPVVPQDFTPAKARRGEAFRESRQGQRLSTVLAGLRRKSTRLNAPYQGNGYTHEAQAIMEDVQAGRTQSDVMPFAESIEVLQVIEAALQSIREHST